LGAPSPFPYQGSKRQLANVILRYFPEGIGRLVEPFAGSAAVSIAAARSSAGKRFWLNDTNEDVMQLWRAILETPEELAERYAGLWQAQLGQERPFYDQVRDRFNRSPSPGDFLYLLARCVKASVRYNSDGEFNQSPDNRRRGARPETMRQRIAGSSRLLGGRTELTTLDYTDVLAAATPSDLVYMDPPYQGVCTGRDSRYRDGVSFRSFADALHGANDRGLSYIISYDGRTGKKQHGRPLPRDLELVHIEVDAGPSTQATLLGRSARTIESLYLSPALIERLGVGRKANDMLTAEQQLALFDSP